MKCELSIWQLQPDSNFGACMHMLDKFLCCHSLIQGYRISWSLVVKAAAQASMQY